MAWIIPDERLPASELENRRVWNRYDPDVAQYLEALDQFTMNDAFYPRGEHICTALSANGMLRIGQVIARSPAELEAQCGFSKADMVQLQRVLKKMGLGLASDTSVWQAYRQTVPENFTLMLPYQMERPKPGSGRGA